MRENDCLQLMHLVAMAPTRNSDESDASMRERLVNSLSQSFPGSALSKALSCMSAEDSECDDDMKDPLSSSCFAELRLDKVDIEDDDELTSLSWLQDNDLLKNIKPSDVDDDDDSQKENDNNHRDGNHFNPTHPPHVPYNPQKHIHSKPPYSFSCLIFMAVEDSPHKKLPVKDIYSWILNHFPYFQNAPTGWKNSVRHNLSLNKCFKKVDKDRGQSIGKGSLWCIDPDYRPNLLQALRKTPYHPYHQLQMLANPQPTQQYHYVPNGMRPMPLTPRFGPNTISPHLFPFLSKRLAQSNSSDNNDIDRDIQDVAHTLVSLKGLGNRGSPARSSDGEDYASNSYRMRLKRKQMQLKTDFVKRRHTEPIVVTEVPSDDHTYSLTNFANIGSPASSIDEEYDFGEEDDNFSEECSDMSDWDSDMDEVDGDIPNKHTKVTPHKNIHNSNMAKITSRKRKEMEEEEQKKIVEGADALLNLAGIMTNSSSLKSNRSHS
ncbi:forkhead box protein N [Mytilus galloprovincialis]|uniref:Forkhead box protein N3 n=3 Tax=Mytilus galloprovincialis TaxID=29158 RepID=A0A8B6HK93_MYTGA|nr:forkhead box protein N [Mytilus galloprovincialis]